MEEIDHYQSDRRNQFPSLLVIYGCTHFICSNWVSRISIKRIKYLTHQFYLPSTILKPGLNDKSHTPPPCMASSSKAIIRGGASIPLHPFLVEVFDYLILSSSSSLPTQSVPQQHFTSPSQIQTSPSWKQIQANLQRSNSPISIASRPSPEMKGSSIKANGVLMQRVCRELTTIQATTWIDTSSILLIALGNLGQLVSSVLSFFYTQFNFC